MRSRFSVGSARSDRVLVAGLALVAVQLILRGWFTFSSWFQFDDLVFLTRVNGANLDADLLLQGYGGHFMPSGFLLTWLFGHDGSLSYAPYAVTLLALQAIASLGFLALLRTLFGSRWAILVPLSLYLFLAISFPAFIWWAAGINQLALQVALGWGLWAHVHHLRTRKAGWAIVTGLIVLACLTFYEKVLLVYGAIAIITLAYFAGGSLLQRLGHVLRTYRLAVTIHAITALAYLAAYLKFASSFGETSGSPLPSLELIWNMLGEALVPGAVGGPLGWKTLTGAFQLSDPPGMVVVLSWVAVAGVIIHVSSITDRSLRAWLLPAWFLAAGLFLLGSARASTVGPSIGLEFRYITEFALVVPLALALARLPVHGTTESASPRPDALTPIFDDNRKVVGCVVAACLLGIVSTWQYGAHWVTSDEPKAYYGNVERTLGTPDAPTPLINVSVPEYIMWGYDYPENTTKYVLRTYGDRMTYPEHSLDRISIIADDGVVRPVVLNAMNRSTHPPTTCGFPARPGQTGRVRLDSTVNTKDLWTRVSYRAQDDTTVTVAAGDSSYDIDLKAGLHNMFFHVKGTFSTISVDVPAGASSPVCLYDAEVGLPMPAAADPKASS